MILFSCSCGAAHAVDDEYAGGTAKCENCGKEVPIPSESETDVVLIYKSGESEEGTPMRREVVEQKLAADELGPTDLVWHEGTWHPLSEVFGGQSGETNADEGSKLRLKKRKQEEDDEAIAEVTPLGPIQKLEEEEEEQAQAKEKKSGFFGRKKKAKEEGEAEESSVHKKRTRVYHTIQIVIGILAIVFGYRFGFGPLISSVRKTPTFVIVQNHTDQNYIAKLGWRRLTQELIKNSTARFELFVGMSEKQTLKLTPDTERADGKEEKEGSGEVKKFKVPLAPNRTVLVNVGGGKYGVFKPSNIKNAKVENDLSLLARAISRNESPQAALSVGREIMKTGKDAFVEIIDDTFFFADDYNFTRIPVAGTQLDAEEEEKPVLVFPPRLRLSFQNGHCEYDHNNSAKIVGGVQLPVDKIAVSKDRTVEAKNNLVLNFNGTPGNLVLTCSLQNAAVEADGKSFNGRWDYRATNVKGNTNAWTWSWKYTSNMGKDKEGKRYEISIVVDASGKENLEIARRLN